MGYPVQRDGDINPERDQGDNQPLFQLCRTLYLLGLGHHLLHDERCSPRIAELTKVWFCDPDTHMNPHLQFTQHVPGVRAGSCWGLIDTNLLPALLDMFAQVPLPDEQKDQLATMVSDFWHMVS